MLSIIENNPFRILGVYSNAEQTEIIKNERKLRAYTTVGKPISLLTDFEQIIECPGQPFHEWEKGFDHLEFVTSSQGVSLRDFLQNYYSVYAVPASNYKEGFLVAYDANYKRQEIAIDISYDLNNIIQTWCRISGEQDLHLDNHMINILEKEIAGSLEIIREDDKKLVLCQSQSEREKIIVGYNSIETAIVYNRVEDLIGKTKEEIINYISDNKAYLYIKDEEDRLCLHKFLLNRSNETIETAISNLSTSKDKTRYSLFWFAKKTEIDEKVLEIAQKGNLSEAISFLQEKGLKGDCPYYSYYLNIAVLSLIDKDYESAIAYYLKLIHTDEYRESFLMNVVGDSLSYSATDLSKFLLEEFLSQLDSNELYEILYEESNHYQLSYELDYIIDHASRDYISLINKWVKDVEILADNGDKWEVRKIILNHAKPSLEKLKTILGESAPLYLTTADNLAIQIIRIGSILSNNANDVNTIDCLLEIDNYALELATGELTIEKCRKSIENLKNLKKQAAYLNSIESIAKEIDTFNHAAPAIELVIPFVNKCKDHLITIRTHTGPADSNYLAISSSVANNALGMVISIVNEINSPYSLYPKPNKTMILHSALIAMHIIGSLDMTSEERGHFNQNNLALTDIVQRLQTPAGSSNYSSKDYRSKKTTYHSPEKTDGLVNDGIGKILGYISLIGGLIAFIMMGIIGLNG